MSNLLEQRLIAGMHDLQRLIELVGQCPELRARSLQYGAGPGDGNVDEGGNASWARRHHDNAVGKEDRLRYRMRHKQDGLARAALALPDAQELKVHFVARHGIE